MPLLGALDNEVHAAVQKLLANDVPPNNLSLYAALQKSNSSLKRRQKKVLLASIDRVLDFIGVSTEDDVDSDAIIEDAVPDHDPALDIMNRSLRANLAGNAAPPANGDNSPIKRNVNGESLPKRQKRGGEPSLRPPPTDTSLEDVGGMEHVIRQMKREVIVPMELYETMQEASLPSPKGILLHGPPGCGKTMLTRALIAEMEYSFVEILGPAIVSGTSGESEKAVREKFEEAKKNAPCLILIDEIDAIAPKRDSSQSQMEKRIVAQLLVSMDDLQRDMDKPVIVLATTNRPDSIDPALRRGGRFGTEINIGVPNEQIRRRILQTQTRSMQLSDDVDFDKLAKQTAGFVGSDLHDLVFKAGAHNLQLLTEAYEKQADDLNLPYARSSRFEINEIRQLKARRGIQTKPKGFERVILYMRDFDAVLPGITPSSKREGFTTVPDVSFKDVGALYSVRKELETHVIKRITNPERYARFGEKAPSGILLWGPPGCGKTLLAKATAKESNANFISVNGPDLLNKFVGESEAAVRKVFTRARSSVPCIIFFDELDALVPNRDGAGTEASARVVNTLLTELDGTGERTGIYVIGATNRPDMIDSAMLRAGRFGTQLFVDLPDDEGRVDIMRALMRDKPQSGDTDLAEVARDCVGFTGADLSELIRGAVSSAVERDADSLTLADFDRAKKSATVSVRDAGRYRELKKTLGSR